MTYELSEADLDVVRIGCECGNNFDMPWDAVAFGGLGERSFCGQCGEPGKMKIVQDPSPNKSDIHAAIKNAWADEDATE